MEKIKFKRYDVTFKGRTYCILIPWDIQKMFVYDFGGEEGTGWVGNRSIIKKLMYSAAVLGFNPTDKIIYFPIRGNEVPKFYSWADDYDLVFTTHQVQLKRSEWKKIKNSLRYQKEKTYIFNYDAKRTEKYFHSSTEHWKSTVTDWKKEYLIETMEYHTIFQVFSRREFQQIYLDIHSFLQENLEKEFVEQMKHDCVPFTFVGEKYSYFRYRDKKQLGSLPFVDFYDEKILNRTKRVCGRNEK